MVDWNFKTFLSSEEASASYDPAEFEDNSVVGGQELPQEYGQWTNAQKWMHHYIQKMRDEEAKKTRLQRRTPRQQSTVTYHPSPTKRSSVATRFMNFLHGNHRSNDE